jgi:hypothetical protein
MIREKMLIMARFWFLVFSCWFLVVPSGLAQEYIQVRAAAHISSSVSDGHYSLEEITRACRKAGISVLFITDRDIRLWEYGVWPLRKLLRRQVEDNSILGYGAQAYLEDIAQFQKRSGVVIIAGAESAPFYYWRGYPFGSHFRMRDYHKHILALGVKTSQDYLGLPVLGNPDGMKRDFNPLSAWPVLLIIAGIVISRRSRKSSLSMIIVGMIFVLNNWPFVSEKFDQYHGYRGIMPYQMYIDYAGSRDILTFWAHPEAAWHQSRGNIKIDTEPYSHYLLESRDYTGFTVFPGGYNEVGKPGGIWDGLLNEYCGGFRKKPVWAIAGLGFDSQGDLEEALAGTQLFILTKDLTASSILDAVKNGRMYPAQGAASVNFRLDDFSVSDLSGETRAICGQTAVISGRRVIKVSGGFMASVGSKVTIKVIKNGSIIKDKTLTAPFDLNFEDVPSGGSLVYYRLDISGDGIHLLTNPIFVKK